MGATTKFYARKEHENIKLSDYNDFDGFITMMINAAHQFNKEISDESSGIKNCDIAMKIIHALPPTLYTLQTILLKSAPPSRADWDLQSLGQHITTAKIHALSAGLKLGTKVDN